VDLDIAFFLREAEKANGPVREVTRMGDQQFPEPTVGALIFNAQGQLFLMRSHKWRGKHVIPGGHIELGETMEQALRREVKEETNLEIRDIEFVCFQEFIHDDRFWKRRHFIFFDYACRTDATDVVLNDEAQDYIWVDLERVRDLPVEHYTAVTIEEYLKRKRPSAT
jgi:nucleoside triphosphatase